MRRPLQHERERRDNHGAQTRARRLARRAQRHVVRRTLKQLAANPETLCDGSDRSDRSDRSDGSEIL